MKFVHFPWSLRQVEDLLYRCRIDFSYETVRSLWNRSGPMFAAEIRMRRSAPVQDKTQWRWHLNNVYAWINGEAHYLWRALEAFVAKKRNHKAALTFSRKAMKRHGRLELIVTDRLRSQTVSI